MVEEQDNSRFHKKMRIHPITKKGQVQTLGPTIIIFIVAAVMLVLGIVIIQSLRDTGVLTEVNTAIISNETLTTVTEAGETVASTGFPGFNTMSVTQIRLANGTATVIDSTNYTVGANTGVIIFSSASAEDVVQYNNSDWNVTYSFLYGDVAWEASNLTLVGLATFASFWEIIVLAVIISIIIGLLLVVFGGRRER